MAYAGQAIVSLHSPPTLWTKAINGVYSNFFALLLFCAAAPSHASTKKTHLNKNKTIRPRSPILQVKPSIHAQAPPTWAPYVTPFLAKFPCRGVYSIFFTFCLEGVRASPTELFQAAPCVELMAQSVPACFQAIGDRAGEWHLDITHIMASLLRFFDMDRRPA